MARFADADIAYVRDHADIEAIVSAVVPLKRSGGSLKGLCPFHDEKSPSFTVQPGRGIYHCFGCGEGGDVISFVQKTTGQSFVEAVTDLAGKMGYKLSTEEDPHAEKNRHRRQRLVDANRAAATFFSEQLFTADGKTAATFLADRGFTRQNAEDFDCGYAPGGWHVLQNHLKGLGFTDDELLTAGLVNKGDKGPYDAFRDRLIFPIRNTSGDIIGFGARKLNDDDQGPKYLNTSETPLYRKSAVLFGIEKARRGISTRDARGDCKAVVVEGYTDVMACHIAGIANAVAACGTAFGEDHAKMLHRLMSNGMEKKVIYVFDGDDAGQKAAHKALNLDRVFGESTRAVLLPDGQDPCELRMAKGDTALAEIVAAHTPLFSLVIEDAIGTVNFDEPESQRDALARAAGVLAAIPSQFDRDRYIRQVAAWTGNTIALVQAAVNSGRRGQTAPVDGPPPIIEEPDVEGDEAEVPSERLVIPPPRDPWLGLERATLRVVLQHPDLAGEWARVVEADDYLHPTYKRLAEDLGDDHPDLDALRRSMLVEEITARVTGEDTHHNTLFLDFAEHATRRRLEEAGQRLMAKMSDEGMATAREEHSRLVTRTRNIALTRAGVNLDT